MFIHCPPKVIPDLQSQTFPDGKRYYVTPNGTKLPSVTTVVGAMKKQFILEWRSRVGEVEANRVSRAASGRGNRVHNLAERYLKNETIDWRKEMPDAAAMFHSIAKEFKHINNIHYLEQALWSERIGLAGRVDLIAEWKGRLSVIDFKTSSKIKKEEDIQDYFAQCVAYASMYEEQVGVPIDQIVILMGVEGSDTLIFVKETGDYINTLLEHITFYKNNK
jgi:genome maintenance exonuclease 1